MTKQRKKSWKQKQDLVRDSFTRSNLALNFAQDFYDNLFFLRPELRDKFKGVDEQHQNKALIHALDHLLNYSVDNPNTEQEYHNKQIVRIAQTHSKKNLAIGPHLYYYWIDAFVMTLKNNDPSWHDDLAYYAREVLFAPISFIISMYHV